MSAPRQAVGAPPRPFLLRWPGMLLLLGLFWAWHMVEGRLGAFFEPTAREAMRDFAHGFWPPAHGREFLEFLVRPLGETVAIAVLGMALALLLALPLSLLAASPELLTAASDRPGPVRTALYGATRAVLNLMRSIPELIWALIFVRAIGIGPLPGVLAIGVAYAGILGKVFAEIFESVPRGPVQALSGAGAPPLRAFTFGVLPTAAPMMASYALYRLDCALRASAILGLVGAGGLGQQLELSMKMFAYDEVATLVLTLFVLVSAVDRASSAIRRRIHASASFLPQGRGGLLRRTFVALAVLGGIAVSGAFLGISASELFSVRSLKSVSSFIASLFPPDLGLASLRETLPLIAETLALSVVGTALAAIGGLLLAYPAALPILAQDAPDRPGGGGLGAWARRALSSLARAVLNLGRTLPELLWALLFIFALGLGPFAGALALAVHTGGVLGRLYAEVLEEVPRPPQHALQTAGGSQLASTFFAVLPQAFPQLVAYTLYRWEVNIRASAVLGVVGAGGLGTALHVSLSLFDHHRTLTLVLIILVLVTAVDLFSGWLRRRVMAPRGGQDAAAASLPVGLQIAGSPAVVLELSTRRARVFLRRGERRFAVGERLPLSIELGAQVRLPCQGAVRAVEDEAIGTYLELTLRRLGPVPRWRLYRALGDGSGPGQAPLAGSLEAY